MRIIIITIISYYYYYYYQHGQDRHTQGSYQQCCSYTTDISYTGVCVPSVSCQPPVKIGVINLGGLRSLNFLFFSEYFLYKISALLRKKSLTRAYFKKNSFVFYGPVPNKLNTKLPKQIYQTYWIPKIKKYSKLCPTSINCSESYLGLSLIAELKWCLT